MTNEMIYKQMKVYEAECEAKGRKCYGGTYHMWNARLHINASAQRFASMERQGLIVSNKKIDNTKYYELV